jgi:hypothetical protein
METKINLRSVLGHLIESGIVPEDPIPNDSIDFEVESVFNILEKGNELFYDSLQVVSNSMTYLLDQKL